MLVPILPSPSLLLHTQALREAGLEGQVSNMTATVFVSRACVQGDAGGTLHAVQHGRMRASACGHGAWRAVSCKSLHPPPNCLHTGTF